MRIILIAKKAEEFPVEKRKDLKNPIMNYADFKAYGFDDKYVYIDGKIHKKIDSREPNFIKAVRTFTDLGFADPQFKFKNKNIFFAFDIIQNLNNILTTYLFKIPTLAAKGKLTSNTFAELLTYYSQTVQSYQNIIAVLMREKPLPKNLVQSFVDEQQRFEEHIFKVFPLETMKELISKHISTIEEHRRNFSASIKDIKNKENYDANAVLNALGFINHIGTESEKLAPMLEYLSKHISKESRDDKKFCVTSFKTLNSYQEDANGAAKGLILISIKAINRMADMDKGEEALFKLLMNCERSHNETAIKTLLTKSDISTILQHKERPKYITPLDEERLSKISHYPLGQKMHDHFFPQKIQEHTTKAAPTGESSTLISAGLSSSANAQPLPFGAPLPSSTSSAGVKLATTFVVGSSTGTPKPTDNPPTQHVWSGSHSAKTDSSSTPAPEAPTKSPSSSSPTLAMSRAKPPAPIAGSTSTTSSTSPHK